jgi:uncharacterized protein (DUF2336 family)
MSTIPELPELPHLLEDKSDRSRQRIATQVGELLSLDDLPATERLAAEALARSLVTDAIDQVRRELSLAVKHAKYLPQEVAFKIAHDVDSVSCPFLEVTEVFSETDWQQLVMTIPRTARLAVAKRKSMSEALAIALTETGDSEVAGELLENPAVPTTLSVCGALIETFGESAELMAKLADRDGLDARIIVKLYERVSAAAREKLSKVYQLTDFTDPIGVEAEYAALFRLIRIAPESRLAIFADCLKREGILGHGFLLEALREGLLSFFGAALAALTSVRNQSARSTVLHGGETAVLELLEQAKIPVPIHGDFWAAIQEARKGSTATSTAVA